MSINPRQLRLLMKDCGGSLSAYRFQLGHMLGLRYNHETQQFYIDKRNRSLATEEFSVPRLAREFLGQEFIDEWGSDPNLAMASSRANAFERAAHTHNQRTLTEEAEVISASGGFGDYSPQHVLSDGPIKALGKTHRLVTEDAAPVLPDAFQDINAFTATVAGLVEIRIMEGFRAPDFIAGDFLKIEPTRTNGGKVIQVMNVAPSMRLWQPGLEIPNISLAPLYCWAFENIIPAAKISLDKYAVLFDISGELMQKAGNLGYGLGYIQEYYRAAHILGVTSITSSVIDPTVTSAIGNKFLLQSPNGADPATVTYQTAAITPSSASAPKLLPNGYNYINKQTQTFTDWTSIQGAQNLLNAMRDPVNNLPFKTEITHVLVDPSVWQLALYIKHQTQVLKVTGTPATAPEQGGASTFPPNVLASPGFGDDKLSELNKWQPYHSNIWSQVWLDAGVSSANAGKRWLAGDPKRAFRWRQLVDLLVQSANPTSADMMSRNIISLWTGQWAGQFVVENPRHVVLNTE